MNRNEWIRLLQKENIVPQLSDGPVALMVRKKGKMVSAMVTREGEWVCITVGRLFRRRMRISMVQLEET